METSRLRPWRRLGGKAWKYISEFEADPALKGAFPRPPRESTFEDTDGSILHWLEILDEDDNRVAWASALETRANLEIEELFVRPEYRRSGHGGKLFQRLQEISLSRGLPLRIWISFPDAAAAESKSHRENRSTDRTKHSSKR